MIFAFLRIGFVAEGTRFSHWLSLRCIDINATSGLHPFYRLDGTPPQHEEDLEHLTGYANSRPVRIGNAAYDQVQLDVLTYANEPGLFSEQIGPAGEALGNFPQALTHLGWSVRPPR